MGKTLLAAAIAAAFSIVAKGQVANDEDLAAIFSPVIEGETLYIKGHIDTHIYDYFSLEAKNLKKIRRIEFNSYGGRFDVALDIALKIRNLHVTTNLSAGHVCASACVVMFAAGEIRTADSGTWFGIHGTRLQPGLVNRFLNACYIQDRFSEAAPTCTSFLNQWKPKIEQTTNQQFDFLEQSGVAPDLRKLYDSLPDDPNWPKQMNLLRKPDLVLDLEDAYKWHLVTHLNGVSTVASVVAP